MKCAWVVEKLREVANERVRYWVMPDRKSHRARSNNDKEWDEKQTPTVKMTFFCSGNYQVIDYAMSDDVQDDKVHRSEDTICQIDTNVLN